LHTKLESVDIAIINSLTQNGRKSFRQIAKEIHVSTPTVESHFSRMISMGVIKNIKPIFNIDKIENQISALVYLKADASQSIDIANKLSLLSEVKDLYMTTGEHNIIVKVMAESLQYIEEFVREKISTIQGVKSASYQIITRTIKDDPSIPVKDGISLKVKCVYCYNEITHSGKVLKTGQYERHFCCNSCLILYKQKYKGRIEAAAFKEMT
jgi:Lrp/AsnC family transcriptional regulator, regulator for asnA, asnC and gidA